jgi:hypothetical protein
MKCQPGNLRLLIKGPPIIIRFPKGIFNRLQKATPKAGATTAIFRMKYRQKYYEKHGSAACLL